MQEDRLISDDEAARMVSPLGILTRIARAKRIEAPSPTGRCPVCRENVSDPAGVLTLRGGIHVHKECATYRVRQRARAV